MDFAFEEQRTAHPQGLAQVCKFATLKRDRPGRGLSLGGRGHDKDQEKSGSHCQPRQHSCCVHMSLFSLDKIGSDSIPKSTYYYLVSKRRGYSASPPSIVPASLPVTAAALTRCMGGHGIVSPLAPADADQFENDRGGQPGFSTSLLASKRPLLSCPRACSLTPESR